MDTKTIKIIKTKKFDIFEKVESFEKPVSSPRLQNVENLKCRKDRRFESWSILGDVLSSFNPPVFLIVAKMCQNSELSLLCLH